MNILTWNCCTAFARKATLLDRFPWDVAVVQECSQADASAFAETHGYGHVWGGVPKKGVAVFAREGTVTLDKSYEEEPAVILPTCIRSAETDLNLLAVWPKAAAKGIPAYVGRTHLALDRYSDFMSAPNTIAVGDFNSNTIWDDLHKRNHSQLVARLADLGLTSVYHALTKQAHGEETAPTFFYWRRRERGYHIDFCFAPSAWVTPETRVEVGSYDGWIASSDHAPLFISGLHFGRNIHAEKSHLDNRSLGH